MLLSPGLIRTGSSSSESTFAISHHRNVSGAPEIVDALRDVSQSQDAMAVNPHEPLSLQLGRNVLQRLSAEATANLIEEHPHLIAPSPHGEARAIDLRFLSEPIGTATATVARKHTPAFLVDDLHALPSLHPKYAHETLVELQHTLHVAEARHTRLPGFAAPAHEQSEFYKAHLANRKPAHESVKHRVMLAARKYPEKWSTNENRDLNLLLSCTISPELRAAAHAWRASLHICDNPGGAIADALRAQSLSADPDVLALAEFCLAESGHGNRSEHLLNAHKLCIDPEMHYEIADALVSTSPALKYLHEARRLAPDNATAASCERELSLRDPARALEHLTRMYQLQPTPENEFVLYMAIARDTTDPQVATRHLESALAVAETNEQRAEAHLMYVVHQLGNAVEHAHEVSCLTKNDEDRAFAQYTLARHRHGNQSEHLIIAAAHAHSPHLRALIEIEFARVEPNLGKAYDHLDRARALVRDIDLEHELALAYGRLAGPDGRRQLYSVIDFALDVRLRAEAHLAVAELGECDAEKHARKALEISGIPEIRAAAAYVLAKLGTDDAEDVLSRAKADVVSPTLAHKIYFMLGKTADTDAAALAHFAQAAEYAENSQTYADCHYESAVRKPDGDAHWREVWTYSSDPAQRFAAALAIGTSLAHDRDEYLAAAISLAPTSEQRAALHLIAGASQLRTPSRAYEHFTAARDASTDRETQAYAEIGAGAADASHRAAHWQNAKKLTTDPRLKEKIRATAPPASGKPADVRLRAIQTDRQAQALLHETLTSGTINVQHVKTAASLAASAELRASLHQALAYASPRPSEQRYHLEKARGLTKNRAFRKTLELGLSARLSGGQRHAALERALAYSDTVLERAEIHQQLAQQNCNDVLPHLLEATKSRAVGDEAGEANLRLALMAQEPKLMYLRHALHAARHPEKKAVIGTLLGLSIAERAPRNASAITHLRQALSQTADNELRTHIELHLARLDESARAEHLAAARRSAPSRQASALVELEAARQAQAARGEIKNRSMFDLNGDVFEHIVRADRLAEDESTRAYARALRSQALTGLPAAAFASLLPDILRKSLYAVQSGQIKTRYRSDVPSE